MFQKEFWKSSADRLKSTKYLAFMAVMIALKVVLRSLYIPVGENLRITFTYLLTAVEASIIGPAAGLLSGTLTDLITAMLFPSGPFFAGYTLSAAVGELIYALFLYRRKISVLRLGLAKLCVNMLVNVGLNSLWSYMLYSKGYIYYLSKNFVKNILILPIEIIGMVLMFNLLLPLIHRKNLREPVTPLPVPWK